VIPPAQHLLEESGIVEPTSSAPVSKPQPEPEDSDIYRMATLGDRFVALTLDSVFLFGIFAVADAWAFMRWGVVEGTELRLTIAALLMAQFMNTALLFIYVWILEAAFGATLGKAMVGIRVVRTSNRNALLAFAIRNLLRFVDGIGFYLLGGVVAACSRFHRRVGDICAHTVVIEEDFGFAVKALAVVLWVGILAGSIWSVPRLCTKNSALATPYFNQVAVRAGRTEQSAYLKVAGLRVEFQLTSASAR
jgi:uncharacterized RDD family membrane protein YckC